MAYVVYYTSVSSSQEIKKKQTRVFDWLDSQKVEYERKDVSLGNKTILNEMREKCPTKKEALPPQIFKEGIHLGGYDEIEEAVEDQKLRGFLKLDKHEDPCQQMQQVQQP